jgi:hypothetical protein
VGGGHGDVEVQDGVIDLGHRHPGGEPGDPEVQGHHRIAGTRLEYGEGAGVGHQLGVRLQEGVRRGGTSG